MIANYLGKGFAGGDATKIVVVSDSKEKYINSLKSRPEIANGLKGFDTEGDDHFISMFNAIEKLTTEYTNNAISVNVAMDRIKDNTSLYRWFIAILVILMEGNQNQFRDVDINYSTPPFDKATFLKLWKNRFNVGATNHNCTTPNTIKLLSFAYNGHDIDDDCIDNVIGCYSNKYFVIPSKELYLDDGSLPNWKQKFKTLLANRSDLFQHFDSYFTAQEQVLLKLGAWQLPIADMPCLNIVHDIIFAQISNAYVPIPTIVPSRYTLTIGGINFELFKILNPFDINNLLNQNIYIIDIGMGNNPHEYKCIYPFTSNLMGILDRKEAWINNLNFNVTTQTDGANVQRVSSATISFNLTFDVNVGMGGAGSVSFSVIKPVSKTYESNANNIYYIEALPTFCMFPNLPLDLEYTWNDYTYFGCDGYSMLGNVPVGVDNHIDFTDVIHRNNVFGNLFSVRVNHNVNYINNTTWTKSDNIVTHFISVYDNGNLCGCILNLKIGTIEYPALLEHGSNISQMNLNVEDTALTQKMRAYVDFGSSSSYIKYKINGAPHFINGFVLNDSLIREILIKYKDIYYKYLLNRPDSSINIGKFLSISSTYDSTVALNSYYPFMESWLPIISDSPNCSRNPSNLVNDGVNLQNSDKTNLITGASDTSSRIIINNMCYMAVLSAIVEKCNTIYIVPSLPNSDYRTKLQGIWNNAINNIKAKVNVGGFNVYNSLQTNNEQYLYESIAISNGAGGHAIDTLFINIDIGDSTTDMSAIYIDTMGTREICGYSSLGYAGKDLLKTTIKDIVTQGGFPNDQEIKDFMKGKGTWENRPLFVPNNPNNLVNLERRIDNLVSSILNNNQSWENDLVSILNIAHINDNLNASYSINSKVAANLIMRYVILMPVIKDFISTSIRLRNIPIGSNINIKFYGGSSKGLNVINNIDKRLTNTYSNIRGYFINSFSDYVVNFSVSSGNDKATLIDGLDKLNLVPMGDGTVQITPPGAVKIYNPDPTTFTGVASIFTYIDPKDYYVHSTFDECQNFNFVAPNGGISLDEANKKNKNIICNQKIYYNQPANAGNEFQQYYQNEIYKTFINNGDGFADAIETLLKDFASDGIAGASMLELLAGNPNNSFDKATHSYIYPEMIKNTIFMYTLSKLLTDYHNNLNTSVNNIDSTNAGNYKFG